MPREYDDAVELLRWERAVDDLCMAAFRRWAPEVAAAVLPSVDTADSLTASLPPDAGGVSIVAPSWTRLLNSTIMPGLEKRMLQRIARRMEASGADKAARELHQKVGSSEPLVTIYGGKRSRDARIVYALPSQRELQAAYLGDVENRMVRTPDSVFRVIADAISEGVAGGESVPKLRDRVQKLLLGNNLDLWKGRATTIARTEVTGAFNAATLQAAQAQAQLLGDDVTKVWVATIDGRTRKAHFAADGQRRALDEPFNVGKSKLRFPGDPRGRAEDVINCRCTIIEVAAGDALPGEDDRQTERGPGDATVRNRRGSRQDEIDRRAAEGVVRARDDDDGEGLVAAAETTGETMTEREWSGVLAPLGTPTGDGRMFDEGMAVDFREFPLPLMWQRQTSDFPHSQAYTVGSIREASVEGGRIVASGVLFDTDEAREAAAQLEEGVTRPSVDLCDDVWELRDGDGNPVDPEKMWDLPEEELNQIVMCFTAATIMGATLVAKPAFADAKITVGDGEPETVDDDEDAPEDDKPENEPESADDSDDDTTDDEEDKPKVAASVLAAEKALLASVQSIGRPAFDPDLFADPGLTEPTRVQYDPATGRVWGHLATFGVCHLGVQGKCIMAPKSRQQYAQFHTHEVDTPAGTPLAVGVLSVGTGHAAPKAGIRAALAHYDNTGTQWAFVRCGEDETGIWFSGVVSPFASADQISLALTCPLSGDWRRVGGNLELAAALAVNTPGYHPEGAHDAQGRPLSLVAAGVLPAARPAGDAGALRALVASAVRDELGRQQRLASLTASANSRGLLPGTVVNVDDGAAERTRRARALLLNHQRKA